VLLDDDSTGAQAAASVPVVLRPSAAALRAALARGAAYVVTNSRALSSKEAAAVTEAAAAAILAEAPPARIVLRGDSTLRAHLVEEHDAVCRVRGWSRAPAVLVPALPAAGRVTRDGVHYLVVDGDAVPVAETEYARDPRLGYDRSDLLEWAERRSGGRFRAADGAVVCLDVVRSRAGAAGIASAIEAVGGRAAAVAIDAETDDDVREIACGIHLAWSQGLRFVPRCSPAPAAALAGATAHGTVDIPAAPRLLVLCGSFVDRTTRQLARLIAEHPTALIEVDLAAASTDPSAEGRRLAEQARTLLDDGSIAVVATPRVHVHGHAGDAAAEQLTKALAVVAAELAPEIDLLVLKGGATSASVVATGLAADVVDVVGPVGHGASLWSVPVRGGELATVVTPGNVGGDHALTDLVGRARSVATC